MCISTNSHCSTIQFIRQYLWTFDMDWMDHSNKNSRVLCYIFSFVHFIIVCSPWLRNVISPGQYPVWPQCFASVLITETPIHDESSVAWNSDPGVERTHFLLLTPQWTVVIEWEQPEPTIILLMATRGKDKVEDYLAEILDWSMFGSSSFHTFWKYSSAVGYVRVIQL